MFFKQILKRAAILILALVLTLGALPIGTLAMPHEAAHEHVSAPIMLPSLGNSALLQGPLPMLGVGGNTQGAIGIIAGAKLIGKNAFLSYKILRALVAGGNTAASNGSITDIAADAISAFTGVGINNVDTKKIFGEIQFQLDDIYTELGNLQAAINTIDQKIESLKTDLAKYATEQKINDFKREYVDAYSDTNEAYGFFLDAVDDGLDLKGYYDALYIEAKELKDITYNYLSGSYGTTSILNVFYQYGTLTTGEADAVENAIVIAQELYGAYVFSEFCLMMCHLYQANWLEDTGIGDYDYNNDEIGDIPKSSYGSLMQKASEDQITINNMLCSFITELSLDNYYVYNPKASDLYINYPATVMQAYSGDRLYFCSMPESYDGIFNPDGFRFSVSDSSLATVTQSGVVDVIGASGSFTVSLFYRAEESASEIELYRLTINIGDFCRFTGGFGTADAPFIIATPSDYEAFLDFYPWYQDASYHFALYNDIDLGGAEIEPLRTYPFAGTFDGNGFAIYNFSLNTVFGIDTHLGLFEKNSGTIRNLRVGKAGFSVAAYDKKSAQVGSEEGTAAYENLYTGVICGENFGTITDCVVENVMLNRVMKEQSDNTTSALNVGAIAGSNSGTVNRCTVRNTTIVSRLKAADKSGDINIARAGGLIGYMAGGSLSNSVVIDSSVSAYAHASGTGGGLFGIGKNEGEGHAHAGGLVAGQYNGAINRCIVYDTSVLAKGVDDNEYHSFYENDGGLAGEITGGSGSGNMASNSGDSLSGKDTTGSDSGMNGSWTSSASGFLRDFVADGNILLDSNQEPIVNYPTAIVLAYDTVKTLYRASESFNPVGIYAFCVDSSDNAGGTPLSFIRVDSSAFGATGGTVMVSSYGGFSASFDADRSCKHNWGTGVLTREPTHLTVGLRSYTCSECAEQRLETVSSIPHVFDQTVTTEAFLASSASCLGAATYYYSCSCGTKGEKLFVNESGGLGAHVLTHYPAEEADCSKDTLAEHYICQVCSKIYRDAEATDEVASLADLTVKGTGHSYTTRIVAPTCTEKGYTSYVCSKCGDEYQDHYVGALGHTETVLAGVGATCTENGKTAGKQCTVCQTVTQPQTVIPATGHDTVIRAGKPATCTESGITDGSYCAVCGVVFASQTLIPATGHHEVIDPAKEETCTESGYTEGRHCEWCGQVFIKQIEIPATGHIEANDAAKAPTCTENGLTAGRHCVVCNTVTQKQNVVPATGHVEQIDAAVPATCTQSGLSQGRHCTVCQVILVKQNVVPATGHTEITYSAQAPTCTQSGLTEGKKCVICGVTTIPQESIPAKGHKEVVDAERAPTCTETGLTAGSHCEHCGMIYTAQTEIAAKGHGTPADWVVAVEPAPGVAGERQKLCPDCNAVLEREEIEALPIVTDSETDTTGENTSSGGCSGSLGGYGAAMLLLLSVGAAYATVQRKKRIF